MSDRAAVLFANDTFYNAFVNHDIDAMEAIWASCPGVSCVHPGWHHLSGRDVVMASWEGMFSNGSGPEIEIKIASVNLRAATAIIICYEIFKDVTMVATNVFTKENEEWRLAHHHSAASPPPPVSDETEQSKTIQ